MTCLARIALSLALSCSLGSSALAKGRTVAAAPDASSALGRRKLATSLALAKGQRVKVAFFDADSTLRESASGQLIASGPKDVRLLPRVEQRIKALNQQGYLVAIVSNQGGVGQHATIENADAGLAKTASLLRRLGARVDYYDFAEHHDGDRKPGIGMAERLERTLHQQLGVLLDKQGSFMVGDAGYKRADRKGPADLRPDGKPGTDFSNSDRRFADNYGIPFFHAAEYF